MSPFRVLIRVRYAECDAQNIVFNARYGDYVDLAATELLRELFGGYDKLLERGIDSQVVRFLVDWKSPARFDEVLEIGVETLRVGTTSYTLQMDFHEHHTKRDIALAEITYVMVSPRQHQKIPVPTFFRAALMTGAKGRVVSFSGLDIAG